MNAQLPKPEQAYRKTRNLKSIDREKFTEDLAAHISPSQCSSFDQLDASLCSLLDKHAPLVERKIRTEKNDPWYDIAKDAGLLEAKAQRRNAEKNYLKTGLTVFKQIYTSAKLKVASIVSKARSSYNNTQVSNCSNIRQLYSFTNKLCGKEKCSPLPNSHSVTQLPQIFCDFFTSKITDIRKELERLANVGPSVVNSNSTPTSLSFRSFHSVSEQEVRKIITSSKPTTCSLDPIPTPLLVEFLDQLLPTITTLINNSLLSGFFPDSFKTAVVKPLLKKSSLDPNVLKNYRPVSNLSFLSKVLEKVILKQLFEYLNTHSLLSPNQSAYRPSHSTETALLKVTNDIRTALDKGDITFLTLLDLSAAFDTIDHSLLFHILSHTYGISGTALSWIQSYLTNRSQSVTIINLSSSPSRLSFGVPQGSVLGPILFIMYTQPLHSLIQSHSISDQSYADDTQLYKSCKPKDTSQTLQSMQKCIADVKSWMTQHRLKLNDDKTEALLIHTSRSFSSSTQKPTSILVCASSIPFSSSAQNLGFILSDDMTMDAHISHMCRSAYIALRQISSIRQYLSLQATKTLVCSLVLSRLDYANSLLSGCSKQSLDRLQKVQNNAARLTLKLKKTDHITPALKQLHWLPIQSRITYKLCLHCHNFFSRSAPAYLSDLLTVYTPSRSLRSSDDSYKLVVPRTNRKVGDCAFSISAPKQWNTLPLYIRSQTSTPAFKHALKTYLFNQYFS